MIGSEKLFPQDNGCDSTDILEDIDSVQVHIQSVELTLEQLHRYIYV